MTEVKVLDINLTSSFLMCKNDKKMIKKKSGKIINITSIVGHTGNLGQANYAASKAGMIAFSKSLAIEYTRKNINVNCVSPGFIKTDMTAKINEEFKKTLISKIPSGDSEQVKMFQLCSFFSVRYGQAILMAKPFMLMAECIWLDNFYY